MGLAPTTEPSTYRVDGSVGSALVPVIGLAHGSRHQRSRAAVQSLMQAVGERLGVPASLAFLDLAEPDLGQVAGELAAAGHGRAVVVPLLFTAAFHATVDTPEAVGQATAASGLELQLAEIVGTGDDLVAVLEAQLATVESTPTVLLVAVGSSDAAANAEIEALARGRVWTGRDARENGLVDELGGFRDAVRIARVRGGLPDDAPVVPAQHVPPLTRLTRPKNSDDPRVATGLPWSGLTDLTAALGWPTGVELRMPPVSLR